MEDKTLAPGRPGIPARWTSSRKTGVGAARSLESRVWFTLSHGIVDEVYYPRVDRAAIRDMGLIVTDGVDYFSEEKRDVDSLTEWIGDGVPGYRLTNTSRDKRYVIEKTILADPKRHVLLQRTRIKFAPGSSGAHHVYVLLAPHLNNHGMENNAWLGDYKGIPMLMAERDDVGLALACSSPWLGRSAGFVGVSDGWQDLHSHKRMTWFYQCAQKGNVALTGEIDLSAGDEFVLALGFGRNPYEAAHRARCSLLQGFAAAEAEYRREWTAWQEPLLRLQTKKAGGSASYRVSTAVLATHLSKDFPGGAIASLSFPWGLSHGDADQGGYHVVWPRDAHETAGALLAAGTHHEVGKALTFFQTTQEADGHWPQNMWLDGRRFWTGIQLDEVAAPILLLDLARRKSDLDDAEIDRLWPMVRRAAEFLVKTGPSTPQDRWEEDAGYTPYTLAVMIAALLATAELADKFADGGFAASLRGTADEWNATIDPWLYVTDTDLARSVGVEGYYVRLAPPSHVAGSSSLKEEIVHIPNQPKGRDTIRASDLVSVDALALVRFGIRAADDPRMLNTVRVIDAVLKTETPRGPCWHRYNRDGYGEHADGSPFDGGGIGRGWPLFAGERAHYELAAGRIDEARRLLAIMESQADDSGLFPEQVWDTEAIPRKHLFPGRPSYSARPLVWAHAEHVKLLRSLRDGAVFDLPPQTVARYLKAPPATDRPTGRKEIPQQSRSVQNVGNHQ